MNAEGAGKGHCEAIHNFHNLSLADLVDQEMFLRTGRKEMSFLSSVYGMQSLGVAPALVWVTHSCN